MFCLWSIFVNACWQKQIIIAAVIAEVSSIVKKIRISLVVLSIVLSAEIDVF